jgi:hypothetical protein
MKYKAEIMVFAGATILAFMIITSGCSNNRTRVASVCETDTEKFWFVTLSKTETCVGVVAGKTERELNLPEEIGNN